MWTSGQLTFTAEPAAIVPLQRAFHAVRSRRDDHPAARLPPAAPGIREISEPCAGRYPAR